MFLLRVCKNSLFSIRTIVSSPYPDITFKKETIAETVFKCCQTFSNRVAFIDDVKNVSYTYGDVERCIKSMAISLIERGFQQGSMISIIASNCPEYMMLQMALSSIGCSVMLCNPNYTKGEIIFQLTDTKSTIIFTSENVVEKVSHAASQVSFVKDIYLIGNRKQGYKSVDDLMNHSGNINPIGNLKIDLDNHNVLMMYSSGTTGLPKGVMFTHTNLVSSFYQVNTAFQLKYETILLALPMFHIAGLHVTGYIALHSGSTMVFQSNLDFIKLLALIEKYKVSHLNLSPQHFSIFLNHPLASNYDLSSVSKIHYGGAPLDILTENLFIDKFRVYNSNFDTYRGYGLTETTSGSHFIPHPKRLSGKNGSVGLLLPNMQCKVVDINTREKVSINTRGELLLKGPNIMKGYFGKPEETEKSFEDNWFITGDIGYYDSDNYFYITDRLKELIKVNTYQVSPAELENKLLTLPGIADCAVVGIPSQKYGEIPKAFIVKNKDINEANINAHMANHLSSYKQLRGGIVFVNNIPRSLSGKISRRLLKNI